MTTKVAGAERVTALDGVRGLAILMVLAHQLVLDGGPQARWWRLLMLPMEAGWIGVQLFFVLSGFLITRILSATRHSSNYWRSFYMRRALRIFPLYYLLLAVMFWGLIHVESLPAGFVVEPGDRVWFWAYVSNWGTLWGARVGSLGHCWSLAVEEQFYLVWPLVVYWLGNRRLTQLCAVLALVALGLRMTLIGIGADSGVIYTNTLTRVDALALGALAAIASDGETKVAWFDWLRKHWIGLAVVVLGVGAVSGGFSRVNRLTLSVGHTVLALACAVWIVEATSREAAGVSSYWLRLLQSRVLCLFGKHSYAIYLIHLPVHVWLGSAWLGAVVGHAPPMGAAVIQIAYWLLGPLLMLAIARVIYWVFEGPVLDLKHHFAVNP